MENNAKCPHCGYIFAADENNKISECPLCSGKSETCKATELFNKTERHVSTAPKRTSAQMVGDWLIFGVSFAAFIVLMYFIISFIFGK